LPSAGHALGWIPSTTPAHDNREFSVSNASVTTGDEEISARERLGLLRGELAELDGKMEEMKWDREELEAEIQEAEAEAAAEEAEEEEEDIQGPKQSRKQCLSSPQSSP
jgi:DNA repair exonuclease SbcCD ATPase subunit